MNSFALSLALLALLCGCAATPPHMMPSPVVFKDARIDVDKAMQPGIKEPAVAVFYATTRAPSEPPERYANRDGGGVRLGVADVGLGAPGWSWKQLLDSDAASAQETRPARIDATREFGLARSAAGEKAFVDRIDAQLALTPNKEVVFYVHGYRVTYEEVTVLMGSFEHYLGHGGAMVVFSWPTGTMFWNYLTDCPRAERYIPDITNTIALLARTQAKNLNLIAYSCGSPLLANALVELRKRHPGESASAVAARYRLGNAIFAASDIDLKTFAREHLPTIMDLARQVIVYVSANDGALKWSTWLTGASRLGRPQIDDLTREDLERLAASRNLQVIDVTSVRGPHEAAGGMKGHGYWYANDWISTDILVSMRYQLPAAERGLVKGAGRNVWTIPPDYPQRMGDGILRLRPELRR